MSSPILYQALRTSAGIAGILRPTTGGLLRAACGIAAAFLLLPMPVQASDGEVDLRGTVVDGAREGRSVAAARVALVATSGPDGSPVSGAVRSTLTNRDGAFSFHELAPGTYRVSVEAVGFEPTTRIVDVPADAPLLFELVPSPLRLDEVVTTASPLATGVAYQAAQALDREALARRMDSSMGAILDGESGVAMRSFGVAPARPVIRGFDGDRVLVLQDGQRMGDLSETAADHAIALDPVNVSRAEVVRGPASLLYGSSALGGVVNLMTDDIPREWSRGLSGGVLTHGATMNRSASGMARALWGGSDWAAGGRLSVRNAGDVRTPESRLPGTHLRSLDGQMGAGFDGSHAGGRFEGGVSLSFEDRTYGVPEAIDDPAEEVEIDMARQSLSSRIGWESGDGRWIRDVELRVRANRMDQQEWEREFGALGALMEEDLELSFLQYSASGSAMFRHGGLGPLSEGAVGVELRGRSLDVGGEAAFTPGTRDRVLGLFTFQERPVGETTRIQFGARLDRQASRTLENDFFPDLDRRRSSTAVSGAVGLRREFDGGWEVGVQIARAHRFPGLEELHARGPHLGAGAFEVGNPELGDEIGIGADLFLKRRLGRGVLEISAFSTRVDDFIAFQPTGGIDEPSGLPVFEYQPVDATLSGFEVAGSAQVTTAMEVHFGVDYVRGGERSAEATPLPTMPPLRGRIGLAWEPGLWNVAVTGRQVATQSRVAQEEEPTPGYALLDFRIGRELDHSGRHSVILRVDNATDQLHRDHLSRVEERGFPMPGRNVNLIYRWSF
jgi:iron complex outermembrane recepter protein